MKFAHIADCHLGGWKIPELQELNFKSFQKAMAHCISEKVDFVLIAGDLFDSAYPPIDILKETFYELRKLKEKNIPCYIIAGSHDFSASGKTFLDVLEKAGFCKNAFQPDYKDDAIILNPLIEKGIAIYGYPGKKSGMEIPDLKRIKLQDAPGYFKILMLHTSLKEALGTLPIESISEQELPNVDYYALGHLHIIYQNNRFVYSSPTFPNNFLELEELKYGGFYIVDTSPFLVRYVPIKIKEVINVSIQISNALTATNTIMGQLQQRQISDSVVLLRLFGNLNQGKVSDIRFSDIESMLRERGVYSFVRSTTDLSTEAPEVSFEASDMESMEEQIIKLYVEREPKDRLKFSLYISPLMHALSIEKQEDEKAVIFNERLISDVKKTLKLV